MTDQPARMSWPMYIVGLQLAVMLFATSANLVVCLTNCTLPRPLLNDSVASTSLWLAIWIAIGLCFVFKRRIFPIAFVAGMLVFHTLNHSYALSQFVAYFTHGIGYGWDFWRSMEYPLTALPGYGFIAAFSLYLFMSKRVREVFIG